MPFSNKDLSDIGKEYGSAKQELADTKASIPAIDVQIKAKQESAARIKIMYTRAADETVSAYQNERKWLNGVTSTDITWQQIVDGSQRTASNIFFPTSWAKTNAMLVAAANGNPTSTTANSEDNVLNRTTVNNGLIAMINLMRNGQSGVGNNSLYSSYSPGAGSIDVVNPGLVPGSMVYISGSGQSAAVLINSVTTITIPTTIPNPSPPPATIPGPNIVYYQCSITEFIAPGGTIGASGVVVSNIPGFSNSERENLSSGSYQNIISSLATKITAAALQWKTALDNQLVQLNILQSDSTERETAKTNVQSAQTSYITWNSKANTGVDGKFVDINLNALQAAYTTRNSFITTRISHISTVLGSVSQNAEGDYSGAGHYLQRYKMINSLINGANGPMYEEYAFGIAKTNLNSKVKNSVEKLGAFSNVVRFSLFKADSTGTSVIRLEEPNLFSIGQSALVVGTDLPSIIVSIVNISGNSVTLDKVIPINFKKDAKAGLIREL